MPLTIPILTLLVAVIMSLFPAPIAASFITAPAAVELKLFQLEHRDVIAIALETRLPATSIADPQLYKLEPQYRIREQGSSLEVTLAAHPSLPELITYGTVTKTINSPRVNQLTATAGKNDLIITTTYSNPITKVHLTTVKRKQLVQPDNTIIFRTYLVLTFVDAAPGQHRKTLVIDPGHGGSALGATSNFLIEKDLNLDIALLSRDLFYQHGYDVYMTRADDSNPSLLDRADTANILNADGMISIHNNSMPDDMPDAAKKLYRGTTALYNSTAVKPAKELASLLANELSDTLRLHQYPLQDRPGLVVLNSSWVPTVIAEVAMMPHPQDAKMLSQRVYRLEAAHAIFTATEKYFTIAALAEESK